MFYDADDQYEDLRTDELARVTDPRIDALLAEQDENRVDDAIAARKGA